MSGPPSRTESQKDLNNPQIIVKLLSEAISQNDAAKTFRQITGGEKTDTVGHVSEKRSG